MYPIITPKKKFKNMQRYIGVSAEGGAGLITPTRIIVVISAKDNLTIAGTSLFDKTGANLIIPISRKKIIMPEPKALLISGK